MRRIVCLLLPLIATPAIAQEPTWVGKMVITKSYGIKITKTAAKDAEYVAALVDSLYYNVKAEKAGKILVVTSAGVEGWFDKADAILPKDAVKYFTAELAKDQRNAAGALQKRAFAYELDGKLCFALKDIEDAVTIQPYHVGGWASRGNLWNVLGKYDRAIVDFSLALRFDQNYTGGYTGRGYALTATKEYDKAIDDFNKAIIIEPKTGPPYAHRGNARFMKKVYDLAVRDFDQAEKLEPTDSYVYLYRAKLLATCPEAKYRDGKKALEQAKKALKLERRPGRQFRETLAAAYAEAGHFNEAIRLQQRVIEDLGKNVDDDARARLTLYRDKKAYRQE
jgi:tetratricopeptide (TPR) repeat protein